MIQNPESESAPPSAAAKNFLAGITAADGGVPREIGREVIRAFTTGQLTPGQVREVLDAAGARQPSPGGEGVATQAALDSREPSAAGLPVAEDPRVRGPDWRELQLPNGDR